MLANRGRGELTLSLGTAMKLHENTDMIHYKTTHVPAQAHLGTLKECEERWRGPEPLTPLILYPGPLHSLALMASLSLMINSVLWGG